VGVALSSNNVKLTWTASTDNIGVVNYKLYSNSTFVADLGNTLTSTRNNAASTQYNYSLSACDAAGNCSANSSVVSVTTPALADSQSPSIPGGLSAKTDTPTTVTLSWTAATDNLAVVSYKVFRSNILLTTLGPVTSFEDVGLKPATSYVYKVQACDAAGNCSADSLTVSVVTRSNSVTPTLPATTISLVPGWNLIGNSYNVPLDVTALLSDTANVTTVWKWLPSTTKWAFYAPTFSAQALVDYVNNKGYDVLSTVSGGEGFWVNAKQAFDLQAPHGVQVLSTDFQSGGTKPLISGWSLIAIGDNKEPSNFNAALSLTPPVAGAVASNVTTLWAWDAAATKWYFYAPSLEASGGLINYTNNKGYLDFNTNQKMLTPGVGFWVNRQ
jgi:hypothetical protein